MLIHTLRRQIHVTNWRCTALTAKITYFRSYNRKSELRELHLSPLEYLKELDRLAIIDGVKDTEVMAIVDGLCYNYSDYIVEFLMSQWEALEMAIHHELKKETENDMQLLELDEAIKALS